MLELTSAEKIGYQGVNQTDTFVSYVDPTEAGIHEDYYSQGLVRRPSFSKLEYNMATKETYVSTREEGKGTKFGWIEGVVISCLLNIFGVIMFLRVGWVVGQAGVLLSIVIIVLAGILLLPGQIGAGGAYYLISRSLGPQFGAAIGVLFSIGMCVAISMYVIGFCETLVQGIYCSENVGLGEANSMTGDALWDIRIYGLMLNSVLLVMALIGTGWVIKLQKVLMALLVLAILLFFIGSFSLSKPQQGVIGVKGWSDGNFKANLLPAFTEGQHFFSVFSVFFPAVTGIMAGANISGDLKDPSAAIPKGTIWAVGISIVTYVIMAIFLGAVGAREVDIASITTTFAPTMAGGLGYDIMAASSTTTTGAQQTIGLLWDYLIMEKICLWGPLVLAGVYAATFSSALASLVGAPRVLQKLASDNLVPILGYFGVTSGPNKDPVRGYYLAYVVSCGCILIGELNLIAPLITMFFMITYAMINFSCFELSLSKSPGWRPSFKYYSPWTALLGTVMCIFIMFLINYLYAIVASVLGLAIYFYVKFTKPSVNWGRAQGSRETVSAIKQLLSLRHIQRHVKNYRPSYLCICDPDKTPEIPFFVSTLKRAYGVVIIAKVHIGDYRQDVQKFRMDQGNGYWIHKDPKIKAFYEVLIEKTHKSGLRLLYQTAGLGALKSNTVIFPFLEDWEDRSVSSFRSQSVVFNRPKLKIAISQPGIDRMKTIAESQEKPAAAEEQEEPEVDEEEKDRQISSLFVDPNSVDEKEVVRTRKEEASEQRFSTYDAFEGIRDAFRMKMGVMICRGFSTVDFTQAAVKTNKKGLSEKYRNSWDFENPGDKNTCGTIDVWWLYDDGGLTILTPYILSQSELWKSLTCGPSDVCPVRVFLICESSDKSSTQYLQTVRLIQKFRFGWPRPILVETQGLPPSEAILNEYSKLSVNEIKKQKRPDVTLRWLRVVELMREHSQGAKCVFVTMPFPRSGDDPFDYYSWLHMLSANMPPTVMMRGSNTNVLTFASE